MIYLKKIATLVAQRRQLNKEALNKVASLIAQKRQQSLTKEAGMEKQGNWLKNIFRFSGKNAITAGRDLKKAKEAFSKLQSPESAVKGEWLNFAKGQVALAQHNFKGAVKGNLFDAAKILGFGGATTWGGYELGKGISGFAGWSDPNNDPAFYAALNSNNKTKPTEASNTGFTNTSDNSGVIAWIKDNPWLAGILALSAGGLIGAGIYSATSKNDLDLLELELEDQNSYKYKYERR